MGWFERVGFVGFAGLVAVDVTGVLELSGPVRRGLRTLAPQLMCAQRTTFDLVMGRDQLMVADRCGGMDHVSAQAIAILLVEDEDLIRELVAEVLTEEGFEVLQAPNAREALSLVDGGAAVDVLFTDVNMPGEPDGIGLAEAVCARRPETRVLVASGRPLPVRRLPCAGRFLAKPYAFMGLGKIIHELTS